jgi:hypothetical protein
MLEGCLVIMAAAMVQHAMEHSLVCHLFPGMLAAVVVMRCLCKPSEVLLQQQFMTAYLYRFSGDGSCPGSYQYLLQPEMCHWRSCLATLLFAHESEPIVWGVL